MVMLALQATNKVLCKKNEWHRKHESIGDQIRNKFDNFNIRDEKYGVDIIYNRYIGDVVHKTSNLEISG
jgi:hypothetical protein